MKITDDMLTEWRKQFEAEFPMPPDCIWTGKGYSQTRYDAWRAQEYAHMWSGFVAARRTTPDRGIIAQLLFAITERQKGNVIRSEDEYIDAARAILKTAPTSDKGEKPCMTCGGSRMVDDGEITGSGGVEFENGPIKCVKDCPDCSGDKGRV